MTAQRPAASQLAALSTDTGQLAKQFIDASIDGHSKPPSKAAYARGLKLAHQAMEELTRLAQRSKGRG